MNMGQIKYEIERVSSDDVMKKTLLRANGIPFTPKEIVNSIKEFTK